MDNYDDKLLALAAKLQEDQQAQLRANDLACEANLQNARASIKPGRKYDKINVGGSGKLMIERDTGVVYGIKAYGKVHKGYVYGTLDTIGEWYWGHYCPVKQLAVPGADGLGLGVSTE